MQRFDSIKKLICRSVDIVLPHRCLASGEIVDSGGALIPAAWQALSFISKPFCACCGMPFGFAGESVPGEEARCASCLSDPPPYETARAALVYDDASKGMILKFKHGDQCHAVQTFIPWLVRAGAGILEGADVLIPVPLHRWRLLGRRYNQAALLAQGLSRVCGVAALPDALVRKRATPIQGHMSRAEREKNVRGAFAVNPRHAGALSGRRVVIVDDVYTSGATVKECAGVLKKAGVEAVHVLAVARVVRAE